MYKWDGKHYYDAHNCKEHGHCFCRIFTGSIKLETSTISENRVPRICCYCAEVNGNA